MRRTKEGGSVVSFVVIAVILAGLLVGGVYAIRRMTAQPQAPQQTPAAPQQQTPADNSNQSAAPAPSQSQPTAPSQTQSQTQSQSQASAQTPAASQLPHTGPEELLGSVIALGTLSAATVAYARSRRLELQF